MVNENYFISSQPHYETIIIFDINSFIQEKTITNIDSINCVGSLLRFKDYIIINCVKGIALFLIKTKEISQYIENYKELSPNKEIFLDCNDNICILNKKMNNESPYGEYSYDECCYDISIIKLNFINGLLEPFEELGRMIIKENAIKIISLINEYLLLCENNVYSLKEFCKNNLIE